METIVTITSILLAVSGLGLLGCGWILYWNSRTLDERIEIIKAISDSNAFSELYQHFDRVSYDHHLWQRVLLRRPADFYPRPIVDLMERRGHT